MADTAVPGRRRLRWVLIPVAVVALAGGGFAGYRYYVRTVLGNFDTVVPGRIYRSGQPTPEHLREWKEKHGVRTIINLRGADPTDEEYVLERDACRNLGLTLVDIDWSATRQPGPEAVRALIRALEGAEAPLLIHCARGVDRSGVASAIAEMRFGGADYETAKRQIGSKYGALDTEAGVVGLLHLYEDWCRARGIGTGGWAQFSRWLEAEYRP